MTPPNRPQVPLLAWTAVVVCLAAPAVFYISSGEAAPGPTGSFRRAITIRQSRLDNAAGPARKDGADGRWSALVYKPHEAATVLRQTTLAAPAPSTEPTLRRRRNHHTARAPVPTAELRFLGNSSVHRVVKPPVKLCEPNRRPRRPTPGRYKELGCISATSWPGETVHSGNGGSPDECATRCAERQRYFSLGPGASCSCLTGLPSTRSDASATSSCGTSQSRRVFARDAWPPPTEAAKASPSPFPDGLGDIGKTITVFMFVSERLGSLWHTCRLAEFSTRFR